MKDKPHFPFHPMLISIYPALALIAFNLGEFDLADGWRPVVFSLLVGVVVWMALQVVVRKWERSALVASMVMVLILGYGQIYNILKKINIGGFVVGRHRYLLPAMVVLLVVGGFWALRKLKDAGQVTRILNTISLLMLIYPIIQISLFEISYLSGQKSGEGVGAGLEVEAGETGDAVKPDVYFIILDAYGREDTLATLYGYDNSGFVGALREMGFYVADCSQSNYVGTYRSLITTLNMEYERSDWDIQKFRSKWKYTAFIKDNSLRRFLEKQGYITVAIESNVYWTEWDDADVNVSFQDPQDSTFNLLAKLQVISDFEIQFLDTTIVSALNALDVLSGSIDPYKNGYERKRARVIFQIDQLEEMYNLEGPKFVFVHVSSPHRPFILGPNGEAITDPAEVKALEADYGTGYANQVTYLNSRMIPLLEGLISKSETQPVIILMGDHGPNYTEIEYHNTNLAALYLPDGGDETLYPSITPVNYFRVVLMHYFGVEWELLEDISYDETMGTDGPETYPLVENVGVCAGE